jgi:hypothetical protein
VQDHRCIGLSGVVCDDAGGPIARQCCMFGEVINRTASLSRDAIPHDGEEQ